MSGWDIDLEDQPSYKDVPEFDELSDALSNELLEIGNCLNSLEKNLDVLEQNSAKGEPVTKRQDSSISLVNKAMELFKEASVYSKRLNAIDTSDLNSSQVFVKDKLNKNLKSSLQRFNQLQKRLTAAEKRINATDMQTIEEEERRASVSSNEEPQIIMEYEPVNSEEIEYQRNLVEEREREIDQISEGVTELNTIFQDLNNMVLEQGEMVDNIENNMYSTLNDTRMASKHLTRADRHYRNKRRLCFWLLLIAAFIILFAVMIIFA